MSEITTLTSENADEFYAARLPKREEPPAAAADDLTPVEAKTDDVSESKDVHKKAKPIQPRINELVAQRNSAQSEAEAARTEAEIAKLEKEQLRNELDDVKRKLEGLSTPATQDQSDRPKRDQFTSEDDYTRAIGDWEFDARLIAHEQQKAQQRVIDNWKARLEEARVDMPDYDAVVGAVDTNFPQLVLDEIVESAIGAEISYFLAKNPAEAKRIAALKPSAGVREIVRLEARMSQTTAPTKTVNVEKSKAPEPIASLKGSSTAVVKDPGSMSYEDWKVARQAGKINR